MNTQYVIAGWTSQSRNPECFQLSKSYLRFQVFRFKCSTSEVYVNTPKPKKLWYLKYFQLQAFLIQGYSICIYIIFWQRKSEKKPRLRFTNEFENVYTSFPICSTPLHCWIFIGIIFYGKNLLSNIEHTEHPKIFLC